MGNHRFISDDYPIILHIILARPRLVTSAATGLTATLLLPETLMPHGVTRAIVGWNVGAILYLILAGHMMFWSTQERMQARAKQEDEGRMAVLSLVIVA